MSLRSVIKRVSMLAFYSPMFVLAEDSAPSAVFGYGTYGGMPYFEEDIKGNLSGGITYEVSKMIAEKMHLKSTFVRIPVNRAENYLFEGKMDLLCLYNPQFFSEPNRFYWSIPFDKHVEFFVIHEGDSLTERSELTDKVVGTQLGYHYNQETEMLFAQKKASRFDRENLDTHYRLLALQRIHALIDVEYSFYYRQQTESNPVKRSDLIDQEYDMHCAISKESMVSPDQVNEAIQVLVKQTDFRALLNRYRLSTNEFAASFTQ